ncbi:hypothetical protein F4776DRAFT_65691 [Hypoxylon sp. NC0597]|nr:hypothetical protein F4776DRAFT_65691 [Hypoxylon sp. NC0597]
MAPNKNSNSTIGATSQKPVVLGPVTTARRVLPKHSRAQRSSLRQALKKSLQDTTATAAVTAPLASPVTLTAPPQLTSGTNSAQSTTSQTPATPLSAASTQPSGTTSASNNGSNDVGTNGVLTSRKGWYRIRSIVAEARNEKGRLSYLVDWEGVDPRTGVAWPSSWVEAKNVSAAAIREWMELQDAEAAA